MALKRLTDLLFKPGDIVAIQAVAGGWSFDRPTNPARFAQYFEML